jgi:hypothetical protein
MGEANGPPFGVPELRRGRHHDPRHGVCLMELTAFLAGDPHSDRPGCTHHLLAAVARVTNDSVSDEARHSLALLAPRLIGTASDDPAIRDAIMELVCERALLAAPPIWTPRLLRELRLLRRHRRRIRGWASSPRRQARRDERTVTLGAASLAFATVIERDQTLLGLLEDCLQLTGRRGEEPPLSETEDAAVTTRTRQR